MFFECNLERNADYFHPELTAKMKVVIDKVYHRTELLNQACDLVCATHIMTPTAFQQIAAGIFARFNADNAVNKFDSFSVNKLAKMVVDNDTGKKYPDRIEWPNVDVLYDTAFVSTEDWEILRHFGIGGSDSSTLCGDNPYNNLRGLWYDKKGFPVLIDKSAEKQAIFDRGHFLEDTVIDIFCETYNAVRIPETRMFRSRKYPAATANIDGILRLSNGELSIFEAKSAMDVYNVQKKFINGAPANYFDQVQQYLTVMDDPRISGANLGMLPCTDHTISKRYIGSEVNPEKYTTIHIAWDKNFGENLLATEQSFWDNHIVSDGGECTITSEEEVSFSPTIDKQIAEKFVVSPLTATAPVPTKMITGQEAIELVEKYQLAVDEAKKVEQTLSSIEDDKKHFQNMLINLLEGTNSGEIYSDTGELAYIISNNRVERNNVDVETLMNKYPKAYKECVSRNAYLLFNLKKAKPKKV